MLKFLNNTLGGSSIEDTSRLLPLRNPSILRVGDSSRYSIPLTNSTRVSTSIVYNVTYVDVRVSCV